MMPGLHIGLDLDNTIIDFDAAFVEVGHALGLLPAGASPRGKLEVRSLLRASTGGEESWMRLQGQVYGRFIGHARLYDGVADFLAAMRRTGARISIVSHKTTYGHFDAERTDLREAARGWLERRGFFDADRFGLARQDLHFLDTRDEKVAVIARIACDAFVDDLPEVLGHPAFPRLTVPLWFAPGEGMRGETGLTPYRSWSALLSAVEAIPRPR
jgi:hypothetical protein